MQIQRAIKHAIDRTAAVVLLLLLAPAFVLIAVAIKLDSRGPIFYRHMRPGQNGEPFEVWKFRSMVDKADALLGADGLATTNRVTRVGRVLRRMSLDEIPQLVNIASGTMSFIGPRPALMAHLDRYSDQQLRRLRMRPGITGLAQVSGRNSLKWSRRIELDNEYIDSYSLWLDVRIAVRTVDVIARGSGQAADRNPDEVDDLGPPRSG